MKKKPEKKQSPQGQQLKDAEIKKVSGGLVSKVKVDYSKIDF